MNPLTREDLARDLRTLGIKTGMHLMVHSSLKSLGRVAEGPKTVVEALMDVVTADGLLMFPSFNHGAPFQAGGPGYYCPLETPTTNGAIPEYFWRQPNVLRTLDPTHAIAAWCRDARKLLKDHHRTITMGPEAPLGRLWRGGGHCLLLGVDYGPNTFKHVVEMTRKVPCLGVRTEAYPVKLRDGRAVTGRTWGWRERNCPISERSQPMQNEMANRRLDTRANVGQAPCILFKFEDFWRVLGELFDTGWAEFPPCKDCPIRPRQSPNTVESDWDFAAERLKPDSEAWRYEDGL